MVVRHRGNAKPTLDHLNLQVARGRFYGLLGPNGAGKTTLISFLCGQIEGKFKTAKILGQDRAEIDSFKRNLGYAPQEIALYPTLTARENLTFFAKLMSLPMSEVERVLNWIGLEGRADEPIHVFSGGMKRRLNLGVALLNTPDLLILDEPTVGVDPQSRNFIFEKILQLKDRGVTLIYSTHYLEEVKKLCDFVGILKDGQMLVQGPRETVLGSEGLERRYLDLTGWTVTE